LSAAKEHFPLRDIFTPPSLVILTEEAHNLIVSLAVEKPASLSSGFPERFFNPRRRPWQPRKNKVRNPVLFFKPKKVTVSRPRLPRNSPQLHHDLPSRCTKSAKTPAKQPLHHTRINRRKTTKKHPKSCPPLKQKKGRTISQNGPAVDLKKRVC
jgi:hypothetical protein